MCSSLANDRRVPEDGRPCGGFSCDPPDPANGEGVVLFLQPGTYHVSWFPTRMNSTVHPPDGPVSTVFGSTLLYLDLAGQFGGVANDFLDTLRGDYAFIITPGPLVKSLSFDSLGGTEAAVDWDFTVYPNPSRGNLFVRLQDEEPKDISLHDFSGRRIRSWSGVAGPLVRLPVDGLAQGAYWLRVSDGVSNKGRRVIIQ